MSQWNRSSTTKYLRKVYGPLAFARVVGERVEFGVARDGREFIFGWGATYEEALVSLAKQALQKAQQATAPVGEAPAADQGNGSNEPLGQSEEAGQGEGADQEEGKGGEGQGG